jgi:serine/threonine protein kinase
MTKSSTSTLSGKQLGDYKLAGLLASGGMAKIYTGIDVKLGRKAAIKILTREMMEADATLTERFQREAQSVSSLEHDNIVPIYQYGEYDDLYFLAMKLIEGGDLADELNAHLRQNKLMDIKRLLYILEQIASALDHAHQHGIIHRDVKPSNILIDTKGRAYLTDFGLVLRQQVDQTMGTAFGTPRYISPEQALASERAVPQSDVYSLAVIVYEAITGSMVFRADTAMQIALSHISEPPPPPTSLNPKIPKAVERELLKALRKKPNKRHKTAGEFISALKDAYGEEIELPQELPVQISSLHASTLPMAPSPIKEARAGKAHVKGDKTYVLSESKRKSGRRLRYLLFLVILAVVGGGAFVALGGDKDGDKDRVAIAPTTAPTATDEPATPDPNIEPTEITVMAVENGEPVSMFYNFDALVIRNDSESELDVSGLSIVPGAFTGSRITRQAIPSGACVTILLQGRRVDPPEDADCDAPHSEILLDSSSLFWRMVDSEVFQIHSGDNIIALCPALQRGGETTCEFDWDAVNQ